MKDLHTHLNAALVIAPAVLAATTTSAAIDLQGYNAAELIVATGAIAAAGDFDIKLQHSDTTTSGDFTDVPEDGVKSDAPASLAADSTYRIGYTGGSDGNKRYVRAVATKAGGTSLALAAVLIRGAASDTPVA